MLLFQQRLIRGLQNVPLPPWGSHRQTPIIVTSNRAFSFTPYSLNLSQGRKVVITVPLALRKRLDHKKIVENSKFIQRQQKIVQSRAGRKSVS